MIFQIGTSGWQYNDWINKFYPKDLAKNKWLDFYAGVFNSVEINSTFYRAPSPKSVQSWSTEVGNDFVFTIKANRYFTHLKKLMVDDEFRSRLKGFMDTLQLLGPKLGCVLFQLPPSLKKDMKKINDFSNEICKQKKRLKMDFDITLECRHPSWFDQDTYSNLKKLNIALVINDSPGRWPSEKIITSDFVYIRFHGSKILYGSSYSDKELRAWSEYIRVDCKPAKRAYCYFNND